MAAHRHRSKPESVTEPLEPVHEDVRVPANDRSKLLDGLDDLLDEIDEALESNAEEFVRNYVQKGGQ
jgi:ubiquitin-like protein Pup